MNTLAVFRFLKPHCGASQIRHSQNSLCLYKDFSPIKRPGLFRSVALKPPLIRQLSYTVELLYLFSCFCTFDFHDIAVKQATCRIDLTFSENIKSLEFEAFCFFLINLHLHFFNRCSLSRVRLFKVFVFASLNHLKSTTTLGCTV